MPIRVERITLNLNKNLVLTGGKVIDMIGCSAVLLVLSGSAWKPFDLQNLGSCHCYPDH